MMSLKFYGSMKISYTEQHFQYFLGFCRYIPPTHTPKKKDLAKGQAFVYTTAVYLYGFIILDWSLINNMKILIVVGKVTVVILGEHLQKEHKPILSAVVSDATE